MIFVQKWQTVTRHSQSCGAKRFVRFWAKKGRFWSRRIISEEV